MTCERLAHLLDAYGSDPRRWPDADRAEMEAMIVELPEAQRLHAKAQALDNLLDGFIADPPREDFRSRILATARSSPQSRRGSVVTDRLLRDWWPRAAALAAAALLGIVIGAEILPTPTEHGVDLEVADWIFGSVVEGWER
jgi:anti-sigma factor RsiW